MIFGVGIDLVRVARVAGAIERRGPRFAARILSEAEMTAYAATPHKARYVAKHFAAKEALLKALGTGLRMGIRWHDMEVLNDALGKPYVVCSGRVEELFAARGITACHLSITDEDGYAAAFVTLECAGGPD